MLTLHRTRIALHTNEVRSYKEFYICSQRRQVMRRIFHFTLENASIDTRCIHIQARWPALFRLSVLYCSYILPGRLRRKIHRIATILFANVWWKESWNTHVRFLTRHRLLCIIATILSNEYSGYFSSVLFVFEEYDGTFCYLDTFPSYLFAPFDRTWIILHGDGSYEMLNLLPITRLKTFTPKVKCTFIKLDVNRTVGSFLRT